MEITSKCVSAFSFMVVYSLGKTGSDSQGADMILSRKTTRYAMLLLGCFALRSLHAATKTPTQQHDDMIDSPSEMRGYIERYVADRGSLLRVYAIDFSTSRRERMKQLYSEWLGRLAQLDFDAMSPPARIDYVLFQNHL